MALWPGARDHLGGESPAGPRASLPARVKLRYWWKDLVHVHTYAHRNALYYSQFHTRQYFCLLIMNPEPSV